MRSNAKSFGSINSADPLPKGAAVQSGSYAPWFTGRYPAVDIPAKHFYQAYLSTVILGIFAQNRQIFHFATTGNMPQKHTRWLY